nr:unnamed protein product [Digitaria exilis]
MGTCGPVQRSGAAAAMAPAVPRVRGGFRGMEVALCGVGARRSGGASDAVRVGWRRGGERMLEVEERREWEQSLCSDLPLLEKSRHDMESDPHLPRNGSDGW